MKKKAKITTLAGLSISICALATAASIFTARASDSGHFDIGQLGESYQLGVEFVAPQGEYSVDGSKYRLSTVLTYPDGRTTTYGGAVLDAIGTYSLEYYVKIGGETKSTTKTFEVVRTTANQFVNETGCTFAYGVDSPVNMGYWDYSHKIFTPTSYRGVAVTGIGADASFRYNGVIDLNALDVSQPLLSYAYMPKQNGATEVSALNIYLIDIYDESNYIHIHSKSLAYGGPYQNAGSYTFTVSDGYSPIALVPNQYDFDDNSFYGAKTYHGTYAKSGYVATCGSFYGRYAMEDNYITNQLYFDYANLAMYANNLYKWRVNKIWKVMDFDDEEFLGLNVWDGFTTGEVYMVINVDASIGGGTLFVDAVNGRSLSGNTVEGDEAPTISVQGTENGVLPYGVAGNDHYYPIMKAVAYSPYCGILDNVKTEVFYGIHNEKVPITQKGFLTDRVGEYRLIYTACDEWGRESKEIFVVNVKEKYDQEIAYTFGDSLQSEYIYGVEKIYLPEGHVEGGSGSLSTKISVLYDGNEVEIASTEKGDYFVPVYGGEYTVVCKCYDFLGTEARFEKKIQVVANGIPTMDEIYLPDAIRKGYETIFPNVNAFVKNADTTIENAIVQITVDGQPISGNKFTPNTTGNITVKYKAVNAKDATKFVEYSKVIQVLDIVPSRYFSSYVYTENASYSGATDYSIVYNLDDVNSAFGFANSFGKDEVEINLGVPYAKKMILKLYDSMDASKAFAVEIEERNGTGIVYHNGKAVYEMGGLFSTTKEGTFAVVYKNATKRIETTDGTFIAAITTNLHGDPFDGFSNTVYLRVEFVDAIVDSSVSIYAFGNQTFNNGDDDWTPPVIELNGEVEEYKRVQIGSTVDLVSANAYDVLGDVESVRLTITSPSDEVIFDDDIHNVASFVASEYGFYSLVYTAEDTNYNMIDISYMVEVVDAVAPTITTKLTMDKYLYHVGDKIKLQEFDAVDNRDDASDLQKYVVIVEPTGMYRIVDFEYKFTEVGTYLLRYTAKDNSFNVSCVEFVLIVS